MKLDITKFKVAHPNDVLVRVKIEKEVVSDSGIILDYQRGVLDRENIGEVIQKGVEVETISIGDDVMFNKSAGVDLTEDSEYKYILMGQDRIIGIITK